MKLLISVRIEYRHFLTCNFLKKKITSQKTLSQEAIRYSSLK